MHRRYAVNDQQKKAIDSLFRERDKLKNEIYNLLSIPDPTHINITIGKKRHGILILGKYQLMNLLLLNYF